jgi:tRNA G26 N,N-dimethylase Trm1
MSDHIPDDSKMDTPRTDTRAGQIKLENEDSCCGIYVYIDGKEYYGSLVDADFARQLERELNQANKERDEAQTLLACLQHAVEEWKTCHDATLTPPPEHWLEAIERNEKCQKITDGL